MLSKVDVVIPANVLDNYKGADNEVQAPVIKVLNQVMLRN